jgi:hypothetical protein
MVPDIIMNVPDRIFASDTSITKGGILQADLGYPTNPDSSCVGNPDVRTDCAAGCVYSLCPAASRLV